MKTMRRIDDVIRSNHVYLLAKPTYYTTLHCTVDILLETKNCRFSFQHSRVCQFNLTSGGSDIDILGITFCKGRDRLHVLCLSLQ